MVKVVRLITGEEILAQVEEQGDSVLLTQAAQFGPTPDGNLGVGPLCFLAKKQDFTVSRSHILFIADAKDEIANIHAKQHGGIVKAPASALTLAT